MTSAVRLATSGNRRAFICPVERATILRCPAPQATRSAVLALPGLAALRQVSDEGTRLIKRRRDVLGVASGASLTLLAEQPALAKLKGFSGVRDTGDGYEFAYPFGWQEVSVSGVDSVYKDIIEPLESLSVQLTPTIKQSITEYGPANEIAGTLASSVLAKSTDEVQLIKSEAEQSEGRDYVAFEFLQKSSRFTRHVVAVATVANGNLILFTTGASEKRWNKMQDKLSTVVKSFKAFTVLKG